jgi:DNA modification methylase
MIEYHNAILRGDCTKLLPQLRAGSVNFILTDPPYITRYKSRDGRRILNDDNDAWLKPAFGEMFRVLQHNCFAVSFYGWPQVDRFVEAYRAAGFRIVGHFVFPKRYTSSTRFLRYQHECAHLLAKGHPKEPAGRSRFPSCCPSLKPSVRRTDWCSTPSRAPALR